MSCDPNYMTLGKRQNHGDSKKKKNRGCRELGEGRLERQNSDCRGSETAYSARYWSDGCVTRLLRPTVCDTDSTVCTVEFGCLPGQVGSGGDCVWRVGGL